MVAQASAQQVAEWIFSQIQEHGWAYPQIIAPQILEKFGGQFVYENKSLGWSVGKDVLAAFRALTGDTVVYERGVKRWRMRQSHDKPSRQQD